MKDKTYKPVRTKENIAEAEDYTKQLIEEYKK